MFCSISGCVGKIKAKGLCNKHYLRLKRTGDILISRAGRDEPSQFIAGLPLSGTDCIIWPFYINKNGYAQYKGLAHTRICERVHGPRPSTDHEAAHSCGKGHEACVAPYHLSWKTRSANAQDKWIHGTMPTGSKIHTTKLNMQKVIEIRELIGSISLREIGRRYGVDNRAIRDIRDRKTWK